MTDTVADLQIRLSNLRRARASGLRSVQEGDSKVEYKSDAEMAAAESALLTQIDDVGGTVRRRVRYIFQSGKGL